ncbi:hypothetical protein FRC20_005194 [Serendipita sp. 405]|nr:hypothetical protein FRC20_005194 [Serendipita sp. 405]
MPSNPLIRSMMRNRKERRPTPLRKKGGQTNVTLSSAHGGDKTSHDQLTKASSQPNQDGLQKALLVAQPTKEKSHWELYNDLALVYDREMIKEWDDSLSLMLVFGALFSAVLTAFIIASIPLLTTDADPPDLYQILQIISHQINDSSNLPYTWRAVPLIPPWWAVQVNALFFASLGCTLMTSLISVLCLQWIRDFDKDWKESRSGTSQQ